MWNYKKAIVIGCPGAGKSTFSKKLHAVTNLPLFHMDALYWNKDCTHISQEALVRKQKEIFKQERFIVDGNYISTLELRIQEADIVFLFDLPTETCLNGAKNRKGNTPEMPCFLPSNAELLEYISHFSADVMPRISRLLRQYNKQTVCFRSHQEVDAYIDKLRTVTVQIDRPLGTFHPEHKDLFYPINYGYIAGLLAGDGEEQDAYVLGVDTPVSVFCGKLIAIIHRTDDVEDKWVVAPENMQFSVSEIERLVHFQEQYFAHTIELLFPTEA